MNLNTFRIFLTVFETRSMTRAAEALHLTQSGVSQHIRALEEELGFVLFERNNRRLYPTSRATHLYERGHKSVEEIESAIRESRDHDPKPRGLVRLGLPVEFGNNVVIPRLSKLGAAHPELNFHITLDFATILSAKVLRGDLDFALIDGFSADRGVKMEPVAHEILHLCGLKSYVSRFGPIKNASSYFSRLDYVCYAPGEPVVRSWFRHHLHRQNIPLRVRAHIFDVQGIAKFILSGLGLGILPDYVIDELRREGHHVHVFEGKKTPLKNEISLIYLSLKDRTPAQTVVMEALRFVHA